MKGDDDITEANVEEAETATDSCNGSKSSLEKEKPDSAGKKKKGNKDEEEVRPQINFKPFTKEDYQKQCEVEEEEEKKMENIDKPKEAHLVDGELMFEEEQEHLKKKDPDLKTGCLLPEHRGILRADYIGKPLCEIDPNRTEKTFIVIAKKINKKYIFRLSSTRAFFILAPWNPLRRLAIFIATNQFFDYFIMLTILANCVFLAMPDLEASEIAEYVFLGIYSFEAVVKLLARGFILNKYTYLRDSWNWLDFGVILLALATIIAEQVSTDASALGNVQGLRTFRVLRALKTVNIVPGLKTIVNALLRAFKLLFEVLLLTVFCLAVFALFALQVYMGILRQKCVQNPDPYNETASLSYDVYYDTWKKNPDHWLTDEEGTYVLCGNSTGTGNCANENYTCLQDIGENPNFGYTSFDHFGWAMLNSFQLITLDFWEDTYDKVIRAGGPWNIIFFMIVVFFGSFYLINLMLAVVALSYEEEAETTDKEQEKLKEQAKQEKKDAMFKVAAATKMAQKLKKKAKEKNDLKTGAKRTGKPKNPQKPMIKMPSKDSGYSIQSNTSVQSNGSKVLPHQDSQDRLIRNSDDGDTMSQGSSWDSSGTQQKADSGLGSVNHGFVGVINDPRIEKLKKPFVKQESNVSSSGIQIHKRDQDDEDNISYISDAGSVVIVKADDIDPDEYELAEGEIMDRNCACCSRCCYCFVPWLKIQAFFYKIVSDPLLDMFITICIVLNTIFMAIEYHDMPNSLIVTLEVANYVFTSIFTLEALMKILALNKFYFINQDGVNGWNIFDLIIVLASLIDLAVTDIDGLSVFRTFRLLRVFKLAQSWPTMRLLLTIILSTLGALGYLTIILGIIIYIFAVIGLQLFNSSYTADKFAPDPVPRWHFNDFYHALLLTFRTLCGEWIEPLWDCMRAADEMCMIVFLPTLVLGNFIILNLFLALLLNAFATDSLKKAKSSGKEANQFKLAWQRIKQLCGCCICGCCSKCTKEKRPNSVAPSEKLEEVEEEEAVKEEESTKDGINKKDTQKITVKEDGSQKEEEVKLKTQANGSFNTKPATKMEDAFQTKRQQFSDFHEARKASKKETDDSSQDKPDGEKKLESDKKKNHEHDKDEDDLELGDEAKDVEEPKEIVVHDCFSVCCTKRCESWSAFDESNFGKRWYKFRRFMVQFAEHKVFEAIILVLIAISSITLAFEDVWLYENQTTQDALYYMNIIFCVLFMIEMIIKFFALGLKEYFTSFWTILDFLIVLISVSSLIAESMGVSQLAAFRTLRTLRALRPLRTISRWQGMRIVVNALIRAIPAIFNVLVVCLVFWLIFSIMGVQFFAGKFFKCVDADGERLNASIIANKTECLAQNYTWQNSNINFDNSLQGYLALFQVATFEGWMELMIDAVDSTGVDLQPSYEANLYAYLYFVAFIIFGAFFTLNLIIGVIIDNFNSLKKKYDGSYLDQFLTDSQRSYYNTLKKLSSRKPRKTIRRPKNRFSALFYDVATSSKFELCIVVMIFANMIVMGVEHFSQVQTITDILDICNLIFTTIFTLEAIVKLIGLRWHYFRQPWNVFDFIVVILSLLGVILDDLLSSVFVTPTLLRVVRVFRIGRVLRLVKAAKGIRKLLFALVISLPALFNIAALLFLVMFIYAIIGMSVFGNLKVNGAMDDIVNFRTFINSFMLLMRLATAAGWNDVLDAMMIAEPDCNPDYITLMNGTLQAEPGGDCGIAWFSIIYMVTYIMFIFLIVINLYIAVIMENFNQAHQQEEVGITEDDFEAFYVVWERYDPLATQFIKFEQLTHFVGDLSEPLGIPRPNEIALVAFDLPIVEGDKLHCLDILMALVKYVLGNVEESEEFLELHSQMEKSFQETFPTRVSTTKVSSTMQKKKEDVAAKTLQRAWRNFKMQKQLRSITHLAMQQHSDSRSNSHASRTRGGSIMDLGRRLSTALSNFFSHSRPQSAQSRHSIKSNMSNNSVSSPKEKRKTLPQILKIPSIGALYPKASSDIDSDNVDL